MYSVKLEIKDTTESNTSASYLDLLLSIWKDGQLHTGTSVYNKREDFNFHITNVPFLSSNIPASPAYGVFISQIIRYVRAYSSYECFILRVTRLSNKLLEQGYVQERFKSLLRKFYGRCEDLLQTIWSSPLTNAKWHSVAWQNALTPSTDQTLYQSVSFVPKSTFNRIKRGFHRIFATVVKWRQGTLTPPDSWTPGPVPFGTCICSTCWDHPFPLLVVIFPDYALRTSLGTFSILLAIIN